MSEPAAEPGTQPPPKDNLTSGMANFADLVVGRMYEFQTAFGYSFQATIHDSPAADGCLCVTRGDQEGYLNPNGIVAAWEVEQLDREPG